MRQPPMQDPSPGSATVAVPMASATAAGAADRVAISIVIPAYNRAALLARQLAALAAQGWEGRWEVVVADNGSTDDTLAVAAGFRECLPSLTVVDASGRRGASHARNVGARRARGEWLLFVDDDDEVQPGWLAAMAAALGRSDFVACATDYQMLNSSAVARARGEPQRHELLRAPYPPNLAYAGGCGLGIRRALHERVGGFDESLRNAQDNDYCFKVQTRGGAELRFVPDALVAVRCRDDRRRMLGQAVRWSKTQVLLYKRYRPPGTTIPRAWRIHAWQWKEWLKMVPRARGEHEWARVLWRFGWLTGQLIGAARFLTTPTEI